MDDLRRMCDREGFGNLPRHRQRAAERQSLSRHHAQGGSLDELHRDVAIVANDTRLVDRDDVRVIQRGGERGLAQQAIERVVVVHERTANYLERDVACEPAVGGTVDLAHSARTQLRHHLVRTDP